MFNLCPNIGSNFVNLSYALEKKLYPLLSEKILYVMLFYLLYPFSCLLLKLDWSCTESERMVLLKYF